MTYDVETLKIISFNKLHNKICETYKFVVKAVAKILKIICIYETCRENTGNYKFLVNDIENFKNNMFF